MKRTSNSGHWHIDFATTTASSSALCLVKKNAVHLTAGGNPQQRKRSC